ncbi:MAG: Alkaline phosphatase like protein, partial [uncultured Rubrobacteraceae bacterium]
ARSDPRTAHTLRDGDHRRLRRPGGLRADAAREHGHPDTVRGHIALRRLPRLRGQDDPDRRRRRRGLGQPGRLVGGVLYRAVGRARAVVPLRQVRRREGAPPGHSRGVVRQIRRVHGLRLPLFARRAHVHLLPGGDGQDELRQVQRLHLSRVRPVGLRADLPRVRARGELGEDRGLSPLLGLRGRLGVHRRRGLPLLALAEVPLRGL